MEDTTQSQSQANTMVMTPTFAGFSKDVKQPHSSETHRRRENSHKCRFARHLHTLLPTLGQSSGSRRHRLLDSLSGRESSVQEAHRRSTCASCKDTEVSCVLSCYYMTAAISRHSMNPKNQSILHSLTTVDILLINRYRWSRMNVAARMPHYAASAAPGLRITVPLTSNAWQHRKRIKAKPQNKIVLW